MMRVLLVGNPNSGKTTLFNALTGRQERVGNWPGVTVEAKTQTTQVHDQLVTWTDLPGLYSLISTTQTSQDEQISAQVLSEGHYDLIINVVDASHLERHLFLTTQLLELNVPMIVVLNKMDLAVEQGLSIDEKALAQQLACPVLGIEANHAIGIENIKMMVGKSCAQIANRQPHSCLSSSANASSASAQAEGLHVIEARYAHIQKIVQHVQRESLNRREHMTAKIDRIALHRFFAYPIFFLLMYALFFVAIKLGGAFQEGIDVLADAWFVKAPAYWMYQAHWPDWAIASLAYGLGRGINTTLAFIPVMTCMYFLLSFLEASGYMARVAFVMDRLMQWLGLPGKAFVPMIIGFGCNVPAVMAARTLDAKRDRLITILMSPFMSCSARLAIYAVFVSAFFPTGGQNIVFSLYLMGVTMAILTGFILKKTLFPGPSSPLVLELPLYQCPSLNQLCRDTWSRLQSFVLRAGSLIIPVCVILGILNTYTLTGHLSADLSVSMIASIGRFLTPLFAPMGITENNWPATVGLMTGIWAKEVVIGSLNGLYAPLHNASHLVFEFNFWESLTNAYQAVWMNFNNSPSTDAIQNHLVPMYGMMVRAFDGQIGAYAYLLFVLLYIPCVSTLAAIYKEASRRWMWFALMWSTMLAYATSTIFYQLATLDKHVWQSLTWCVLMCVGIYCAFSAILKAQKNYLQFNDSDLQNSCGQKICQGCRV